MDETLIAGAIVLGALLLTRRKASGKPPPTVGTGSAADKVPGTSPQQGNVPVTGVVTAPAGVDPLLLPAPAGYYGRRFSSPPPGWPPQIGTRQEDEFVEVFDAALSRMLPIARTELARLGYSTAEAEAAIRLGVPTVHRLALHESSGQFYRPANTFDDSATAVRGCDDWRPGCRISASGAWQFNQGAVQRMTRDFRVNGQLVHGPLLPASAGEQGVHHGHVDAQFMPIVHYIAVAAWAARNGLDPVQAIWVMHSGSGYLSSWARGEVSSRIQSKQALLEAESDLVDEYLATGDRSLLAEPFAD